MNFLSVIGFPLHEIKKPRQEKASIYSFFFFLRLFKSKEFFLCVMKYSTTIFLFFRQRFLFRLTDFRWVEKKTARQN